MNIFVPAMGRVNTKNRDGSEIRFAEIAKHLSAGGHNFHIYLPIREIDVLKSQGVGGKNIIFDQLNDVVNSESDNIFNVLAVYLVRILKALFKRYPRNIDVVYVPSDFLVDVIPGLICRLVNPAAKLVVCLFLVAPNPLENYRNIYRRSWSLPSVRSLVFYGTQTLSIWLINCFSGTILVLNGIDWQKLKQRAKQVTRVTMGVGLVEFDAVVPPPKTFAYDGIFIGRLHPQKGLPDLLAIWKKVVAKKPSAKLAVIGGGSRYWKNWFCQKVVEKGLDEGVDFLGFVAGKQKIELLKRGAVFVMPSRYESFGMTVLEAWASGLPVCVYDIPVFRSVFSDAPVYAPFEDTDTFADNVLQCIQDRKFAVSKARHGRLVAEQFDWPKVAAGEVKILIEA